MSNIKKKERLYNNEKVRIVSFGKSDSAIFACKSLKSVALLGLVFKVKMQEV